MCWFTNPKHAVVSSTIVTIELLDFYGFISIINQLSYGGGPLFEGSNGGISYAYRIPGMDGHDLGIKFNHPAWLSMAYPGLPGPTLVESNLAIESPEP